MSETRLRDDSAAVTPAPAAPPPLTTLTGIRGLLLFPVLAAHSREFMQAVLPATRILDNPIRSAFLAVDVFFMLSGFVLSYNYAHRFAAFGRRELRGYFVSRFARIYPVYLLTLLFAVVVVGWFGLSGRDLGFPSFLGNLVMLQTSGVRAWNMPSWSVACEVGAYMVFPFVAAALLRLGWKSALAIGAAEVLLLIVAVDLLSGAGRDFNFNLYYWARLVVGFSLGCLMWVAWRQKARRHRAWDVVALVALALTALVVHVRHQTPSSYVVVGFLAVFVAAAASADGPLRAVLAWRPLTWLGETSYSVYLVHFPIFLILFDLLPADVLASAPLVVRIAALAAFVVVPLVIGAAVCHLVEEPSRGAIRRLFTPRPRSRPASSESPAESSEELVGLSPGAVVGSPVARATAPEVDRS